MYESDKSRVAWLKVLLLLFSVACIALLLLAAFKENFTAPWRAHQARYAELLAEQAQAAGTSQREYPIEIRQVFLAEWGRVDRCVTCHVGIDNPGFKDQPQPLAAHSGDILKYHPADKFGCTICHQGQGRATDKDAAHGNVPHWNEPLLAGDFVQATCAKCHRDDEVPQAPILSRGRRLLRELGCVGCHRTGNVVAREKAGPQLDSIGSKVSQRWLIKWLTDPNDYLPQGKMPHYDLSPSAVSALAAYLMTFRNDSIEDTPLREGDYDEGATVYREAQCIVCHVTKLDYAENPVGGKIGPNLLKIGNKINQRWLFAFLKNPHSFLPYTKMPGYHFSDKEALDLSQFAVEEWVDYDLLDAEEKEPEPPAGTPGQIRQGKQLYAELGCAGCHRLGDEPTKPMGPDLTFIGSTPVHLLPFGDADVRHTVPDFLYTKLKSPKALHYESAKMPDFHLTDEDAKALTIALMSLSELGAPSRRFEVPKQPKIIFNPKDEFGRLERHYRCLSCHKIRDSGELLASDLTLEGNRVNREWLYHYMNKPYSMRRTLTIAMPIFHFPDDESRLMADYMAHVFVDSQLGAAWRLIRDEADPQRGKALFDAKGCIACHQLHGSGGDVGPSLTTQVPEFPHGTWVGDKLKGEWIYPWLKNPQALLPESIEPNLGLSDQEAIDLTAYLLTLKNPEFQKPAIQKSKVQKDAEPQEKK